MYKRQIPDKAFNFWQGVFLILVASFISIVAWIWAYRLLAHSDEHSQYFVAGHVMAGLACICSSLIALVATIARQIRNTYSRLEKRLWPVSYTHLTARGRKQKKHNNHHEGSCYAHIFRFTMKTISYHNYRIVVRSPIQPPTVKGLPFSKSGCMKISSVEGR